MFETPRRLHYAAIFVSSVAYMRHALWPLILILLTGPKGKEGFVTFLIVMIGALLGLLGLVGPLLSYLFTNYVIRDDSLILNSGYIWRRTRVIPLARIQNVNTRQNLLHRILGAAAVKIETAAGAGVEAELPAVSRYDAIELQNALLRRKAPEPAAVTEPPPLYTLTPKQLVIAGALSNRLVYILIAIAGLFQFDDPLKEAARPIVRWFERQSPLHAALIVAGSTVALVVIGWLLSVAYSLSRFYGFRMERHPKGLKLTYGLFTKIQSIVPVGRVQALRLAQPLLFQPFGLCEAYADTAGSFDAKEMGSANKLCPITPIQDVDRIGAFVFPEFRFSGFRWHQVSPKAVWRYAIGSFIAFGILLAILSLAFQSPWPLVGAVPLAPFCIWLGFLHFRYVGYAEQDGFLASRQGIWWRHVIVVPLDRTQYIVVNQSYFQRRWGLSSLVLVTSSPAGGLVIADVETETALELQERLSRESLDRRRSWAGGN